MNPLWQIKITTNEWQFMIVDGRDRVVALVDVHERKDELIKRLSRGNIRDLSKAKKTVKKKKLFPTNTSGTTGVSYLKSIKKWQAYIYINGKQQILGDFVEKKDAIATRKAAEK